MVRAYSTVAPHTDLDTPILTSSLLPVLFRNKE